PAVPKNPAWDTLRLCKIGKLLITRHLLDNRVSRVTAAASPRSPNLHACVRSTPISRRLAIGCDGGRPAARLRYGANLQTQSHGGIRTGGRERNKRRIATSMITRTLPLRPNRLSRPKLLRTSLHSEERLPTLAVDRFLLITRCTRRAHAAL